MGFGVWGLRFGVWGLRFEVWGLGFEVWGLGFGVWGLGFEVWGLRTHIYFSLNNKFDIIVQGGWKSEGYLLGRPLDEGFIGFAGLWYNWFK